MRNESEGCDNIFYISNTSRGVSRSPPSQEHACWDPKGGELCLIRAKPEETLVEARSRSDVQIDGKSWV